MVSVVHSLPDSGIDENVLTQLVEGLTEEGARRLVEAIAQARELYGDGKVGTGETAFEHGLGAAMILASLNLDLDSRLAALLFAVPDFLEDAREKMSAQWGASVADLVDGLYRLKNLRPLTQAASGVQAQPEILRKMLLALAADIRVVMVRLASRTQTLRWFTDHDTPERADMARESLQIYAPLANRLGVWQIKWEIEDLAFRFLEPATYKRIAKHLDEKRLEREAFIVTAVARLKDELARSGVTHAEVYGRPKHIYSIWNKMRKKDIEFAEVYDVRALRIVLDEVQGLLHGARHRACLVAADSRRIRRLHFAPQGQLITVRCIPPCWPRTAGRSKCRSAPTKCTSTAEMGVAAHWRYKEVRNVGKSRLRLRRQDRLAAATAVMARRNHRFGGLGGAVQARRARRHDLCDDAAGPGDRPAQGRDADRFRLPRAYRSWPSLSRREGKWPSGAPEYAAAKRPAGRHHRRQDGRTVARLAVSRATWSPAGRARRSRPGSPPSRRRRCSPRAALS